MELRMVETFNLKAKLRKFFFFDVIFHFIFNQTFDAHLRLKDWYARNYSANWMTLVLQANLDLETLQKFAVEIFEKIPNKGFNQPEMREKVFNSPVEKTNLCKILRILPPSRSNSFAMPIILSPQANRNFDPVEFLKFVLSG